MKEEAEAEGELAQVGDRCFVDEHYGTIRFIGEVPPTAGVWYGVDWDDKKRGKHDGTKDGVVYFKARYPKSGSFVRPPKVYLGRDVMSGVKERYGRKDDDNAGVETEQMYVQGSNKQRTTVEVVGAKSVNLYQSQFDKLNEVALRGLPISYSGHPGLIAASLPNVTSLDISDSLIGRWSEIAKITSQLSQLEVLNVSDNVIAFPDDNSLNPADFSTISTLFINRCHLTWEEMLRLGSVMTSLSTVHACYNKITTITQPCGELAKLKTLNLEANNLEGWKDVLALSGLPSLENLILNNVGIEKIEFNDVAEGGTTKQFASLKALSLFHNKISEWTSINELDKLASFEDLKFRFNPLTQDKQHNDETIRGLIVARIGKLQLCNRTEITPEERHGAELDYLKKFGKEWRNSGGHQDPAQNKPTAEFTKLHPRYQACINAHGAGEDSEFIVKSTALKDNLLSVVIECPQMPDKSALKKRFPVTMTLQKVKAVIQRLYRADPATLVLQYTSPKKPGELYDLDNDMREIGYFGMENDDVILVKF